ncbi:hypothetical protein [Thermosipho sp. (in: thermotogales)]|jgi:hypothetical protein|uniref:hypothetical protein n=1 Tax=Thermosipho sp. (in: thermotogales) TaxID=1968895 RepID=UPI00257A7F35|nr:hypothetical protein [Thermosipho sp. (in: thermotogales)]MBZ4649242.1 hypothetical protein [Thermosipho sp. (in: thermotogales)]
MTKEKFWDNDPIVVNEFEKGSKLCKALLGKVNKKYCVALQTFFTDKDGNERPGKGYFIVDSNKQSVIEQIDDSIHSLNELKKALVNLK